MSASIESLRTPSTAERQARIDLAACHRLAARFGYSEGIDNHFTLMVPGQGDRFFLARFGLLWSEVRASDFMEVTLDGKLAAGRGLIEDTALHIHAAVHRRAPEVQCLLHTHMPYATALSMLEDPTLEMASQNALGFHGEIAYLDYSGLALDGSEGERLARALDGKPIGILRNHGVLVTGSSPAQAFERLYFLERACQVQILACATGKALRVLPAELARSTAAQFRACAEVGGEQRTNLHFAALKRLLDREEPGYAD